MQFNQIQKKKNSRHTFYLVTPSIFLSLFAIYTSIFSFSIQRKIEKKLYSNNTSKAINKVYKTWNWNYLTKCMKMVGILVWRREFFGEEKMGMERKWRLKMKKWQTETLWNVLINYINQVATWKSRRNVATWFSRCNKITTVFSSFKTWTRQCWKLWFN